MKKENKIDIDDGIKYINIYSQGKTDLGRLLSNFSRCNITLEKKTFYSVEAYWYWLCCEGHSKRDNLCKLYGWQAKSKGRELLKDIDNTNEWKISKLKILRAIRKKINNDNRLNKMLKESTLPFTHHYVYADKIIKVKNCDWMINYIDKYRTKLKKYE